ncbi:small ribosomal subunit protein uS11m [Cryptomeria japonica]|uniref:small ribosomal subunit protein uS11m n=1 Tax=Cryptomeria japonica TaxID=3369 RepID=UPI0027DA97EC|nr:small ribosomal subunit protein uS11m [Cryptomeria japonica]
MLARIFAQRRACTFFSIFSPGTMELQQDRRLISLFSVPGVGSAGEMFQSCMHGKNFSGQTYQGRIFPGNAPSRDTRPLGRTSQGNNNFVRNALEDYEQWEQKRFSVEKNIVHFTLKNKNIFISVTDDKGNKKLGASAGCLKEIQGGSRRRTKYAVEATAEHVGRSAKVLGMKSVVVRVKGSSYFGKKKAAVLSFRKGLGPRSNIMYIEDVTQLPHNGCRLPKRRRA